MLAVVENIRRKQLAWFEAVLLHRKWNMSQLAREAGVDHSTLSKFRADPLNVKKLSTDVVAKIEAVGGIQAYDTQPPLRQRGIDDVETAAYDGRSTSDILAGVIEAAHAGSNALETIVLKSRALETAGYLEGDILIIDRNAEPRSGDLVYAEIFDTRGEPKTIVRIFEDPYLVAATFDPHLLKPLHVGRDPVVLRGVVVSTVRQRRAA